MEIMPTGSLDKLEKDMKDLYQAYSKRSGQVDENKPEHKQKSKEELSQEPKQEPTYQGPTHKKLVTFVEKKLYNQIVKDDLFEVTNIITDKTTSEATKAMVTYLLYMARDKHPALYEKLMGLLSFYRLTPSEELQAQYDAHPAFDSLKLPDFEFCKEYACMEREDYDSIKETYDKFGPFRYFAASKPENVRIVMKDEYSFYVGETRPGTDIREGMGISIRRSGIREGYWADDKQHFFSRYMGFDGTMHTCGYKAGVLHGQYEYANPDGTSGRGTYANAKEDGLWQHFDTELKLEKEIMYKAGTQKWEKDY